jgi:tetratricopeptide (TPR) repeat protein
VTSVLLIVVLAATTASGQSLPSIDTSSYPPAARESIARAMADAREHPADGARVGRLGMVLQAWEEWTNAAIAYERARALDSRFDWFYLGGIVASRQSRFADAVVLLTRAVQLSPESVPARLALADALYDTGSIDQSGKEYQSLLDVPAAEPHARYGVGRALAAHALHEEAVREFDRAVALFPEFGAAWYARGLSLRRLGKLDDAQASLARAQTLGTRWPAVDDPTLAAVRALRDDAGAHMTRGLSLERAGDLSGAIQEYETALASNPSLAQAHINLIGLYGRQRKWPEGEAHYRAAVALGSSLADAHYNYGVLLLTAGRLDDAGRAFEQALAANPHHAGAWNNLGQIHEARGQAADARDCYERAVAQAPADAIVRFNLGRMLIATHQYGDAIRHLEMIASEDHPERARFLFALATAHVLNGDVAGGRQLAIDARDLARARGQADLADAIDRDLARLR